MADYVAHGAGRGWSPHPLFEDLWVYPKGAWRRHDPDPLSHFLRTGAHRERSPHPLIHRPTLGETPLPEWFAGLSADTTLPTPPDLPPLRYADLLAALTRRELHDGSAPDPSPTRRELHDGSIVSVLLPVRAVPGNTVAWLRGIFRELSRAGSDLDVEVVVALASGDTVEAAGHDRLARAVGAALAPLGRVVVALVPSGGSGAVSYGAAVATALGAASGAVSVVVPPRVEPAYWSWLPELVDRLGPAGGGVVQALLVGPDRTVSDAGRGATTSGEPVLLLRGLAQADAVRLGETVPAAAGVVAVRTAEALAGLDPGAGEADAVLGLRPARLAADVVLVSRPEPRFDWPASTSAGFGADPDLTRSVLANADYRWDGIRTVPIRVKQHPPRLRWSIDTAATGGHFGERWGDWAFAQSLAGALEALGQRVVVEPREARERPTRGLDDVVLTLRGQDRAGTLAAAEPRMPLRLMWIISHPLDVDAAEAASQDLVFAASPTWGVEKGREWGVDVRPLLQCTDASRFHPLDPAPEAVPGLVFVANTRSAERPVVADAIASGQPFGVYGAEWGGLLPDGVWRAQHVPNDRLGRLYAAADVVLNDHWPFMREHGFYSNRLFDAVACGARVLSDPVAGAEALFGGSVRCYSTREEFAALAAPPYAGFADAATRLANAAVVLREHTFAARARELLAAVLTSPALPADAR